MLLVTPANSQRVYYLFGIDGSTLDALDRVLVVWFPNSYELARTSTSLQTALTQHSDDAQTTTQLPDRSVVGLELHAEETHPGDWRTRLTPFADFHEPEATDPATWPLGSILTAIAQTDTPVVVQTLLQPLPDWSAERDERIYELRNNEGGTIVDEFLTHLTRDHRKTATAPTARSSPRMSRPKSRNSNRHSLAACSPSIPAQSPPHHQTSRVTPQPYSPT